MIETQVDTVMIHGQAAIFRDLKVRKPETEDQQKSNGNITMVDFKKWMYMKDMMSIWQD